MFRSWVLLVELSPCHRMSVLYLYSIQDAETEYWLSLNFEVIWAGQQPALTRYISWNEAVDAGEIWRDSERWQQWYVQTNKTISVGANSCLSAVWLVRRCYCSINIGHIHLAAFNIDCEVISVYQSFVITCHYLCRQDWPVGNKYLHLSASSNLTRGKQEM